MLLVKVIRNLIVKLFHNLYQKRIIIVISYDVHNIVYLLLIIAIEKAYLWKQFTLVFPHKIDQLGPEAKAKA